jgi:Fe2+ transport system protein FeoA
MMNKKQLSSLVGGEEGKIVKIRGGVSLHRNLLEMGFFIGRRISVDVFDLTPTDNFIKVRVNGSHYSLEKDIAANIQVEVA